MPRYMAAALLAGALCLPSGTAAHAETLTLEQAIAKASEGAPRLEADGAAIEAARAGRTQAAVRPNPTVTVSGENIAGSGQYNVFSQPEITATYGQTLERGGKRDARKALLPIADIGVAEAERPGCPARSRSAGRARLFRRHYCRRNGMGRRTTGSRSSSEMQAELPSAGCASYKDPLFVETRAAARVAQAQINAR
jgi:cobalt-zinc-cadmium efflux system outer membrane protein